MLNILRKKAQSTLIQAMVLLIAVVFIFWGVGTNLNNNRNAVATVNGEEIPVQDYQRAYDRAVENYRQQFGGRIPPGLLEGLNLKGQVVGQLIQAELFRQGAAEMGLAISKEATQRTIKKMEAFQENGQFDLGRYKEVLSQNRLTPTSFEGGIRNDMLTSLVVETIGSFAVLPETEMQGWLDFSEREINLGVRAVKSSDFEDKVEVDDAELATWFEQHKTEYTSEPKVRLRYLEFDFDKDMDQVQVTDDALRARYASERAKYTIPEQRHARHILFKVTEQDDQQTVEEKKKLAEDVLARIRKGEDFSELARQYSEGPTKDSGGDLGFFSQGRMVKPFDDVVFSMQTGTVSDPVRTSFGFHIIKLEEVRPATTRSFDEVKDGLARAMKKEEVKGITFKRASEAYEGIMRAGSIDKYSEQSGAAVAETDFFSRSQPPSGTTADPGFLQATFGLGKGELSSLVELKKGYVIVFVSDVQEPVVPELADVRERVVRDYRREKAVDLARAAAAEELAQAREQGRLGGENIKETGFVKRTASQAADVPAEVITDAFSLAHTEHLPEQPVGVGNTFYLYEIRDRRLNLDSIGAEKKRQLKQQVLASVKNRLVSDWLAGLREKAEIWTNDTMLQ
ncbi:MAG: SurA N-terminal domain-containing protein [Desulfobulbaceae bacterium]|nr:SurA N-terminal domain-containing protein [Desulfobulbaceae bacterium]